MRTYSRRRPECQIIEGVHDLCRLCLQKPDETVPIFDENSDNICATLSLRIMICVGLEITREDSLPNVICIECYRELSRYYAFRKKCELSYQKLKHHIQAIKEEHIRKTLKDKQQISDDKIFNNCTSNVTDPSYIDDESEFMLTCESVQFCDNVKTSLNGVKEDDPITSSPLEEYNLDISTFLTSILAQLGVITRHDDTLEIIDPNVNTLELIMGEDNSVTLELMQEDEEVNDNSNCGDKSKMGAFYYSENKNELTQAVHNDTEVTNGSEDGDMTVNGGGAGLAGEVGAGSGGTRAWCGECRKWLASAGTLRRHRLVHTGERPHACRECGRAFAQRDSLKRHRLVHLERRPFQCDRCAKSFTQRSALVKHVAGHDPPHSRALMLHRCTKCPKVFLYPSSLSRHMRTHYGYVFMCGACERTFSDKSSLLRHARNSGHAL